MTINKPISSVMNAFQDLEIWKASDDQLRDLTYCHVFNENTKIFKARVKGNIVIYDRVLIMFTTIQEVTDGSYVMIDFSVDTDKAEVDPSWVLATSEFMVTHFEKIGEDKTRVSSIIHFEPNGMVPSMLVNLHVKGSYTQYAKLKTLIEDAY